MKVLAPAKINLALHVTGKRADGYHLLDSVVVFADWGDDLEIVPAEDRRLTVNGPFAKGVPTGPDNLIWRAADLLDPKGGAHIQVTKNIPHGAGLAGGTADAAAALKALAASWGKAMPDTEALLQVGADLPVCVFGRPVRMRGIGEALEPLEEFPALNLVLAKRSAQGAATAAVFAALERTDNPGVESWEGHMIVGDWLDRQRNDLEPATDAVAGSSRRLRQLLLNAGARTVRMTGSGTALYALFDTAAEAKGAVGKLGTSAPRNQWVKAVRTEASG